MNFPLIITGAIFGVIGTIIAGIGWNWDKITKKNDAPDHGATMQAQTSGDQSPAININQPNIILQFLL